jgi:AcrR family transcriptional regulator
MYHDAPGRVNIDQTLMSTEIQSPRRTYEKRRRAEQEARTRLQITEAAVELHGTVGPARTTIKDVAALAGVQRGTVYRHFPDLDSLFTACSTHWVGSNPPPSAASWSAIANPEARLRHALRELYGWYVWAEPMLTNVRRDASLVPACARAGESFRGHFEALHAALMQGRNARGRARLRLAAAIGHALDFPTWRSLTREQGLRPEETVELMVAMVARAAEASGWRAGGAPA